MKTEETKTEEVTIADQARLDTYELMKKIGAIQNEYLNKESIIPVNDRFLVVSRAINGIGMAWFEHFWRQADPENKLKEIREKADKYDDLCK